MDGLVRDFGVQADPGGCLLPYFIMGFNSTWFLDTSRHDTNHIKERHVVLKLVIGMVQSRGIGH